MVPAIMPDKQCVWALSVDVRKTLASRLAASASSSSCVYWRTRRCMDWHRHTSPTSVTESHPSAADRDSDPLLMASWNQMLMHTRGRETVSSTLVQDGTKDKSLLHWLSPKCPGTPRPCNYYYLLNCHNFKTATNNVFMLNILAQTNDYLMQFLQQLHNWYFQGNNLRFHIPI